MSGAVDPPGLDRQRTLFSPPATTTGYIRVDEAEATALTLHQSALVCGDACRTLQLLPDACVQTVVTSPPYWSLRDYAVESQIGRDDTLSDYIGSIVAAFDEVRRVLRDDGMAWLNMGTEPLKRLSGQADDHPAMGSVASSRRWRGSATASAPATRSARLRVPNSLEQSGGPRVDFRLPWACHGPRPTVPSNFRTGIRRRSWPPRGCHGP